MVRGKMNEVSSGLRSLSFGSLQLHSQNGGLQSQNSSTLRKTSRTLSGSREKERYLPFIFKYLGRRKVIMLILVIIAILALTTGFLTASKGLLCFHCLFMSLFFCTVACRLCGRYFVIKEWFFIVRIQLWLK